MTEKTDTSVRPSRVVENLIAFLICEGILGLVAFVQNLPIELVLGWALFIGLFVLWVYNYFRKPKSQSTTTKTYRKQADAAPDIIEKITSGSRLIRVLCCSSTSVYPILSTTIKQSLRQGLNVRILLIDPDSSHGRDCIESIAERENLKLSGDDYVKIIQEHIQKWLKLKKELQTRKELKGELTIGLYEQTPTYRGFIIDDSVAFIGHYFGATHGFDNPLFRIETAAAKEFGKIWFSQFAQVYDSMWEDARKIQ